MNEVSSEPLKVKLLDWGQCMVAHKETKSFA